MGQLISAIRDENKTKKQGGTAGSGHIPQAPIAPSANVHLRNSKGQTALHLASSKGDKERVEFLVDSGSNVDEQDEAGRTPLMLAAKMGQSGVVSTLLLAGAKVGLECVEGQTALHYAAEGNHTDCGPLLVEAGEDVTAADVKSRTSLDIASVNETKKQGGTALMWTAGSGHMDIAQTLIAASANVHLRNSKGQTALHLASSKGHKEMVELLVDSDSNVDEQDEAGRTPLMLAAEMGQSGVVSTLLLAGAKVGLECVEGQTALHYAAEGNHIDCGLLLVEAGEDVTAADVKSQTPLDIASVDFYEAVQQRIFQSLKPVVVLAGSADIDASTLIRALQDENRKMAQQLVKLPQVATELGCIEPDQLSGQIKAQFYSIAECSELVSNNESFLNTLLSKPGVPVTLLLQVKATEEEGTIKKKLLHWLQPRTAMSAPSLPQVIVVVDCLDHDESEQQVHDKLQRCTQLIQEELQVQLKGHILVDCQNPQTECINKIGRLVRDFSQSRPATSHLPYNLSLVVSQLRSSVNARTLQLHEFAKWMDDTRTKLPRNLPSPEELCQDLLAAGHTHYLANKQDSSQGSLVLDLPALLHKVYGTLFSGSQDKVNQFGLLHCSQLTELFPEWDEAQIQEVLVSLQLCIEVDPLVLKEELLQMNTDKEREGCLYFSSLVSAQPQTAFPDKPDLESQHFQWVCWQLRTAGKQRVPAHSLQTILHRATTYSRVSLRMKEHSCTVWVNGFSWSSTEGVDVAVQVSNSNVVQIIGCSKRGSEELYLYTSTIVRDVIQTIPELSLGLGAIPYIVHPYTLALWEDPNLPSSDTMYPILSIVQGIHRGDGYIPSLPGEAGDLPNLIRLDELFGGCSPPLSTLEDIAGCYGPPSPNVAAAQAALKDLCMIPDGIQSLTTDSTGGQYQLEPPGGQEDEPVISLKVPPGAVKTRGGSATVDYAVIPDGPFRPPDGYQFGSVVVYISYDGRSFTLAHSLSLPHWYGGQDGARDGLVFAMAPHAMEEGEQFYHFKTLDGGEFGVRHGNLNLNDPHVLLAVVFRQGVTQSYYASLWTCQYSPTLFCNKVVITFSHHYWLQLLKKYWLKWKKADKNESPVVKFVLTSPDAALCGELTKISGPGWIASIRGGDTVHSSKLLYAGKCTRRAGKYNLTKLEAEIRETIYPPSIHCTVRYPLPPDSSMETQEVDLVIKGTSMGQLKFPVKVTEVNDSHYLCHYATPTLKDLDGLVVGEVAGKWEPVAIQLGVEESLIAIVTRNHPGDCEGACRDVFVRWLKGERNSGRKEKTWHALLKALERSGFGTLANGLRRQMVEQESRAIKLLGVKTGSDRFAGIVQFQDVPSDCACVVRAVMYLKWNLPSFPVHTDSEGPARHISTHQMLRRWDGGTVSFGDLNSGTDFVADHTDTFTVHPGSNGVVGKLSNGYAPFNVTTTVRNWVNGDPNNGILVMEPTRNEAMRELLSYWRFWGTGSHVSAEDYPYIEVSYHSKELKVK